MPAALVGAAIGAAGSYFGNKAAGDSAEQAAKYQYLATQEALKQQKEIYNKNTQNEQPYMSAGSGALGAYGDAAGINGADAQKAFFQNFQQDPYYQSVLNAGTNAVENSAAARGTLYGGNTLKAINDYGGNLLMQAYQNRLGQLQNLYNTGLSATNALAGVGTSFANASSNLLTNPNTNGTNARYAAGQYQGAGINGVSNALIGGWNNYNYNSNRADFGGGDYGGYANDYA